MDNHVKSYVLVTSPLPTDRMWLMKFFMAAPEDEKEKEVLEETDSENDESEDADEDTEDENEDDE